MKPEPGSYRRLTVSVRATEKFVDPPGSTMWSFLPGDRLLVLETEATKTFVLSGSGPMWIDTDKLMERSEVTT